MKTIIIATLLLSCKQTTSAPHQKTSNTGKFIKIDEKENKILVVDASGKKLPVAVHHVRSNNSDKLVKQEKMSQLGNKFVSPKRLLRWERMVLTYQAGDTKHTCVVSPATAKSFHDDDGEPRVEIDGKTCETDDTLYVFARLCRAKQGKIITAADLTTGTSDYNGYHIKLSARNFACVIKRGSKEIPLPSYCFIDDYQRGNTMISVFKDKLPAHDSDAAQREIDEHVIEAVFRTVVPTKKYIQPNVGGKKNCRFRQRKGNIPTIGYQYEIGESEELGEAQTEEAQPTKVDN